MARTTSHFETLGLEPGVQPPAVVERRFRALHQAAMKGLGEPTTASLARDRLDALHRAFNILRDPVLIRRYVAHRADPQPLTHMQLRIAESLSGGLIRHSARRALVRDGASLGFSPFQTQLLIAQVQFGDDPVLDPRGVVRPAVATGTRLAARFAATVSIAAAMFLLALRALDV